MAPRWRSARWSQTDWDAAGPKRQDADGRDDQRDDQNEDDAAGGGHRPILACSVRPATEGSGFLRCGKPAV
jgi:hypothetical protein